MAMNSGDTDDNSNNPEVRYDMEGTPIGQEMSTWQIIAIVFGVGLVAAGLTALYLRALSPAFTGG